MVVKPFVTHQAFWATLVACAVAIVLAVYLSTRGGSSGEDVSNQSKAMPKKYIVVSDVPEAFSYRYDMVYIKDKRTGFCYALMYKSTTSGAYIESPLLVPCTEGVEKLLTNAQP